MAQRRWIRLDTTCFESEWLVALRPGAQLAWVRLLIHVKAHGAGGRAKALSHLAASRVWNIDRRDVASMVENAIADGAVQLDDDDWVVPNWPKYQETDTTSTERTRRWRERGTPSQPSQPSQGVPTRTHCRVTETGSETEEKEKPLRGQKKESGATSGTPAFDDGETNVGPPVKPARRTALSADWKPKEQHHTLAAELGLDCVGQVEEFRDYEAGKRRLMLDWDATFRNWLRTAVKFQGKNGSRPGGNERLLKHAARISQIDLEQGKVFGD